MNCSGKAERSFSIPTCFALEWTPFLLAAFAKAYPGEGVLDLCSGTGIIPILMGEPLPRSQLHRAGAAGSFRKHGTPERSV